MRRRSIPDRSPRGTGRLRWLLAFVAALPGACRDGGDQSKPKPSQENDEPEATATATAVPSLPGLETMASKASRGAESPNVNVGLDGSVVLSWLEPGTAGKTVLRWRRLHDGEWSDAATVVESDALFVNWADVPAITTDSRGHLVATWLQQDPEQKGYGIRWSASTDGGASWSTAQLLPEHRGGPEYGFVSFAATPDDELAVFWLDGRASHGHEGGQMQLRSAVIGSQSEVVDRRLVDERVCDCCQTSAASTAAGPVVAYRDRTDDEIRDIRLAGPAPDQSRPVAADGWHIDGCPVNGPAVSSRGDRIAVAWFTAASDTPAVQVAFASLQGPFGKPTRVDLGHAVGRVDLAWLDADHVAVSFLERSQDPRAADLLVRRVSTDGDIAAAASIAKTSATPTSGFPRMVRTGDHLVWAWTHADGSDPPTVHLARAPVSSLGT